MAAVRPCLALLATLANLQAGTAASKPAAYGTYDVDTAGGLGRRFDGVGGLSGGGATSKLLISYSEPYRSDILDVLFKPGAGASLQILKVEIGGDDQTTDGVEASHMHEQWEGANYERGYEWWLMKEAKKRNPSITLYALAWSYPHWIRTGAYPHEEPDAHKATAYLLEWLRGAREAHNLTIDYLGLWNERYYALDWVLILRSALDAAGFGGVKLLGADAYMDAGFVQGYLDNKAVMRALYGFGLHYPGTRPPQNAIDSGVTLWSSEDYSQYNSDYGAACWGRTIVQNYVNGRITAGIAWNLVASYYGGLHYTRCSLMTAMEPWSGHYVVNHPIVMTSHLTSYTLAGWRYLRHGAGVGTLAGGGSYVALVDDSLEHFTLVIETMTHAASYCGTPLPAYNVSQQLAHFRLGDVPPLRNITRLCTKRTRLFWREDGTFENATTEHGAVEAPQSGGILVSLEPNTMYTLSTYCDWHEAEAAHRERAAPIPHSERFPAHYEDNFDDSPLRSDPALLSPMRGVWEIQSDDNGGGRHARQMVLEAPMSWCYTTWWDYRPNAVIGSKEWRSVNMSISFRVPHINGSDGVFLAARVNHTGCDTYSLVGVYCWLWADSGSYAVTADMNQLDILDMGTLDTAIERDRWYDMALAVHRNEDGSTFVQCTVGGKVMSTITVPSGKEMSEKGFSMIGSNSYGHFDIDNLRTDVEY